MFVRQDHETFNSYLNSISRPSFGNSLMVNENNELCNAGILETIREKFKGIIGKTDRTNKILVENSLITFLNLNKGQFLNDKDTVKMESLVSRTGINLKDPKEKEKHLNLYYAVQNIYNNIIFLNTRPVPLPPRPPYAAPLPPHPSRTAPQPPIVPSRPGRGRPLPPLPVKNDTETLEKHPTTIKDTRAMAKELDTLKASVERTYNQLKNENQSLARAQDPYARITYANMLKKSLEKVRALKPQAEDFVRENGFLASINNCSRKFEFLKKFLNEIDAEIINYENAIKQANPTQEDTQDIQQALMRKACQMDHFTNESDNELEDDSDEEWSVGSFDEEWSIGPSEEYYP